MNHLLLVFITASFLLFSCSTPSKKVLRYAKSAKEPYAPAFVVLSTGDTLSGNELRFRKKNWFLDGKEISPSDVRSFQTKDGFFDLGILRVIKGKITLLVSVSKYSTSERYHNSITGSFQSRMTEAAVSTYYIRKNSGMMIAVSLSELRKAVQDCPKAASALESAFAGSYSKKHPGWVTNDYPRIIKAVEVYNAECK
ncbi:MAG: hypothetical protein QM781_02315 [Chitinophagaceae bacterium]